MNCARATPTDLTFIRPTGKTYGVLSWSPGAGAPAGSRYRVLRNWTVVGQTTASSMQFNVDLNASYTVAVRLMGPKGQRTACLAAVRVTTTYELPTAPQYPSASDASGPTVTISWQPSTAGDAPVAGYRLLRGTAVFGQTQSTSMTVPVSNNASYTFTVVAVDTNHQVSAPSTAVQVQTGHSAPPSPAGLQVTDTSPSSVSLSWQASTPPRGGLEGYRVLRDGTVVGQFTGTSADLTGLPPSTSFSFTVEAVDTLGYVSAPSDPVSATTEIPVQTTGHAYAYVLASTDESFADFQAHYTEIGTVMPTFYDCNQSTTLSGANVPLITNWAQSRGVKVVPRFNCQNTNVLHQVLNSPALSQTWINYIVGQTTSNNFNGANVDFEAGMATDRNAYTTFITALATALHAAGKELILCVSAKYQDVLNNPRSTFFDYNSLSAQVDVMFVMAWGIHWATSAPGAQDDMTWVSKVVNYIKTLPRVGKYVLGMQLYAMDWANGGGLGNPANTYEYSSAMALAAQLGVTPTYNASADAWTFSYTSGSASHVVWYTNAATEADRIALAAQAGFGGVGFWRLGEEDQSLWSDPLLTGTF